MPGVLENLGGTMYVAQVEWEFAASRIPTWGSGRIGYWIFSRMDLIGVLNRVAPPGSTGWEIWICHKLFMLSHGIDILTCLHISERNFIFKFFSFKISIPSNRSRLVIFFPFSVDFFFFFFIITCILIEGGSQLWSKSILRFIIKNCVIELLL